MGDSLLPLNPDTTLPDITLPATRRAAAANNYRWLSRSSASARESYFPSFLVRPDGVITGRLRRHVAGILILAVHTDTQCYDSGGPWRDRAMRGILHSGRLMRDRRSDERTQL